ncbi:MAG: hypothetical protein RLZZ385_2478 [Pseudomonadota bacterium]|jgi:hypothetical protein
MKAHQYNCLTALLLGVLASTVLAQPAEQTIDPLNAPAVDPVTALERSQELTRRLQDLDTITSQAGVYDVSLIEAYRDLAGFYVEQGEHAAAADALREALQITRINEGLNSSRQQDILQQIIQSEAASEDWQAVDAAHHLKLYVADRNYAPGDPDYLAAVDEYGRWKLRVLQENLLGLNNRNLEREAEALSMHYQTAIAGIDAAQPDSGGSLIPLLYGKSQVDMSIARALASTPYQYFPGTVSQYINETVCNNVRDANGGVVRSCYTVKRENPRYRQSQQDAKRLAVMRSARQVEEVIDRLQAILDSQPDLPPERRTEVQTRIGELLVESQQIDRVSRRGALGGFPSF